MKPLRSLDERIRELVESDPLPRLYNRDGDTHVYIDPPPMQPSYEPDKFEEDTMIREMKEYFSQPFRMRSEVLKATGSPWIEKRLGPSEQYRVQRRRGEVNTDGIKYVLDLTPSSEGNDAVSSIQNLCCSRGVRLWRLSMSRWHIIKALVGGHDEFTLRKPARPQTHSKEPETEEPKALVVSASNVVSEGDAPPVASEEPSSPSNAKATFRTLGSQDTSGEEEALDVSDFPEEYTAVRHRFAILRVLAALEGLDPKLDSAVKVWSTCAAAQILEVKYPLTLTDYIVRWLRASPNTYFIEVCPEVTLRISEILQVTHLCREAFAILVGEEALNMVHYGCLIDATEICVSVFGRTKEGFPESGDDWVKRIQFSRYLFIDRIRLEFDQLATIDPDQNMDMQWIDDLQETQKLRVWEAIRPDSVEVQSLHSTLIGDLKTLIREKIYMVLCDDNYPDRIFQIPRVNGEKGGIALFPKHPEQKWMNLDHHERIFTRYFWEALSGVTFSIGWSGDLEVHTMADDMGWQRELRSSYKFKQLKTTGIVKSLISGYQNLKRDIQVFENILSLYSSQARYALHSWPDTLAYAQGVNDSRRTASEDGLAPDFDKIHLDDVPSFQFSIEQLLRQIETYLHSFARRMLSGPNVGMQDPMEFPLTSTLCCLNDEELRALPLWAEGDDDGTGGTFNECIPDTEMGFSAAGPSIHTGSAASSDGFEIVDGSGSTIDTSTVVNDGYSAVGMDRRRTYSDSESMGGDKTPVRQIQVDDELGFIAEDCWDEEMGSDEENEDYNIRYVGEEGEEDAMRP
jgi:hypothetical protein